MVYFVFSVLLLQLSVAHEYFAASVLPFCHDDERFALLEFSQSFVSDISCSYDPSFNYPKVESWKLEGEDRADCCSWDGVKCDMDTGHVVRLDLSNSYLFGSINSTSALFRLVHLGWLSLSTNSFNFSEIPSRIRSLSKLSHLDLSSCYFSGQIPAEMLELSQLKYLDLSINQLQLQQPGLRSLVEKLTNLKMLNLDGVNISSSIPNSITNLLSLSYLSLQDCQLQGTIPSSLVNLTELVHLNISFNNFWGALPISIGNLGSLQQLHAYNCRFSGQIPSSLGNLTQLSHLDLSSNIFSGKNPSLLTWISKLNKLTTLVLSDLNLVGDIPFSLMNLTQLTHLEMSNNQLTGPIPSWLMKLNQLSWLYFRSNNLTGQIPSQISNLTQLNFLDLSSNHLQGPIPGSIFELNNLLQLDVHSNDLNGTVDLNMFLVKMERLEALVLSSNSLSVLTKALVNTKQSFHSIGLSSCNLTRIPSFLQNQDQLRGLDLSSNKISGQIPGWLLNASIGTLEFLNLSFNLLTGFDQYPSVLQLSSLLTLDLRSNKLQESLPRPPSFIHHYLASNNKLIGEIPSWICYLTLLQTLDLSYNNLSGMFPQCLGNFSYELSILGLQGNNFYGNSSETSMIGSKMRMMDLSRNKLQGKVPRLLANCKSLEFLNLGYNQVVDTFPHWLGSLPELKILILKSNKFYGVIGDPKTNLEFPKLHIIDLSLNMFVGELPSNYFQCWSSMKAVNESQLTYMEQGLEPHAYSYLTYFEPSNYAYSFAMSNKGIELKYGKISNKLASICLSGNEFTGKIPSSISSLRGLINLNFSNNNLIGCIPSSLSNLRVLESLDLSNNKLSGEIPQQLSDLKSLEFIDVSHNSLNGRIPQGRQFDTFDNKSFEGNPGLFFVKRMWKL